MLHKYTYHYPFFQYKIINLMTLSSKQTSKTVKTCYLGGSIFYIQTFLDSLSYLAGKAKWEEICSQFGICLKGKLQR